ncbi:MAG: hypothetical protein WA004_20450 [Saprospiraceae bacterium]
MTIKELTALLSQYPPDTRVVVAGYEGGFNDITIQKIIQLELDANKEWWNGQHEEVQSSGEPALLLAGENRISAEYLGKQEEKEG